MNKNENDYKTVIQVDGEPVFKKALTEEEIKKAMTEEPEIFTRWADPTIYEKDKEIERLNNDIKILLKENDNKEKVIIKYENIINEAIDKAKTMKASMLLDTVDGIDIDSQFVHNLFELIDFLEKKELKEGK